MMNNVDILIFLMKELYVQDKFTMLKNVEKPSLCSLVAIQTL